MVHNVLQHEVENFDSWYTAFKGGEAKRNQHGIRINGVYRGHDNPNHVTIHTEADDHSAYDNLMADSEFLQSMKTGGVKGQPQMHKMSRVQ